MIAPKLKTWLKGQFIGEDTYGNKYYSERFLFGTPKGAKPRRWVVYNGFAEASKVPAEWHGWLHYTTDQAPVDSARVPHEWELDHKPNMTGTKFAYRPPGHTLNCGSDFKSYYQSWAPEN
ncbi:MAG: NADH:ubiquinone oxidoreductase subunit NDUFA12 [Alphaproteobacteria bacterium]